MATLKRAYHLFLESFDPLKNRNVRIYMAGQAVSLIGTWMQITAQIWIVWQLTHTAVSLGVVALLSQLPFFILGPLSGVWADRLNRRKILITTQTISMILAFILAFLVQSNLVQLWHVYLLAALLGIVSALDMTSQQAFIADISPKEHIRKTVTINLSFVQLSRMLGPALAGWVIAVLGAAAAFWINGISFIAVIFSLLIITSTKQVISQKKEQSVLKDFKQGVKFILKNNVAWGLIVVMSLMSFFGWSIVQLLPAVSGRIIHGGAGVLGTLMGASGAGALCGSLFIVPIGQKYHKPAIFILIVMIASGLSYFIFSFSSMLYFSVIFQFLASMFGSSAFTMANGIIQIITPVEMRARVLSILLMISFGLQPIASFLVGFFADIIGIEHIILINAVIIALGTIILFIKNSSLGKYKVDTDNEVDQEKFSIAPVIEE